MQAYFFLMFYFYLFSNACDGKKRSIFEVHNKKNYNNGKLVKYMLKITV